MPAVRSVAIIGCGPAGSITIDALVQERCFEKIAVFERRERPGGCWIPDPIGHVQRLPNFKKLGDRNADETLKLPVELPAWTPKCTEYRYSDTSIYPLLETNVAVEAMEFSQEPISEQRSAWSVQRHGLDTPFRHHTVIQQYIEDLVDRNGYQEYVQYNTTVERTVKKDSKWDLILRKEIGDRDYWWKEEFDAVIVASGHYSVPFIPHIKGLAQFAAVNPGCVEHTKSFRGTENYHGKRVVTVGASISAPDVAAVLAGVAASPVHCVVRGNYHPYFGDWAFRNPHIRRHRPISHVSGRTVFFEDGTSVTNVDKIILGTGYSWTMHFLPDLAIRNNRIPGLYQHIFPMEEDPTLLFVGAVGAGFTFKVFEWQAVLAARFLAGRVTLPPLEQQKKWEQDRIDKKGNGAAFTALYPEFEEYFEEVRGLAGEAQGGTGRVLPKFDTRWREIFDAAHLKRIAMWQELNRQAEEQLRESMACGN